MRLLKVGSRGEVSLTTDVIKDVPPYAILSHAWGADDKEVTFDDLQSGSGRSKAGYTKIQFCAEQARKDGINTSGSTHAASINRTIQNSQKLLTQCSAGTVMRQSATYIYHTLRLTSDHTVVSQ
jgi:hypothetical protein